MATPYLEKKLNISFMQKKHWGLRKAIVELLSKSLLMWLSKSFANFAKTAHQLHWQKIVSSSVFIVCNAMDETDALRVLSHPHMLSIQYKHKVESALQLKILGLLEGDMFLLYFLEWILDDDYDKIKDLPESAMALLQHKLVNGIFGMVFHLFVFKDGFCGSVNQQSG